MNSTNKWQVIRKVLFKIPFFPLYIYHYALLTPFKINGTQKRIIINYGPINWIFRPRARVTFEFYEEENKKWEQAKTLYWNKKLDDDAVIEKRLSDTIMHIRENLEISGFFGPRIKPLLREENYDFDENNCEHFCSYAVYGTRFSSQIDVFAD